MDWNSTIEVQGVAVPVEPVAGALVRWDGEWFMLADTDAWDMHYDQPGYENALPLRMADICDPILPAVPDGLTCRDMLAAVWPELRDGMLYYGLGGGHSFRVAKRSDGKCKPAWNHGNTTTANNTAEYRKYAQWFDALLAWLEYNGGERWTS